MPEHNEPDDLGRLSRDLEEAVEKILPQDGISLTPWPGLVVSRSSRTFPRFHMVYRPSVCLVVRGTKRVYAGNQVHQYDPLHYLVVALPLPLEGEICSASVEHPFLGLGLEIDAAVVGQLMLEMDHDAPAGGPSTVSQPLSTSQLDRDLAGAFVRLLDSTRSPSDCKVLTPGIVREIYYRVLEGEQGALLRRFATQDGRALRIARVVRYLDENFGKALDVASIARNAGMGESTLHHAFREIVGLSPMQYLKRLRLHQARTLIVSQGLDVGEAAYNVGYNSPSQFSREFKRMFGIAPSRVSDLLPTSATA